MNQERKILRYVSNQRDEFFSLETHRKKDSIVNIVTGLRTGRSRVHIWAGSRDFSLLQNFQTGSGVHQAFFSVGDEGSFPRGNAARA
jgi:hypothetical protein